MTLNDPIKAKILKYTSIQINKVIYYFMFTTSRDTAVFVFDSDFKRIEHKFDGVSLLSMAHDRFEDHIFAIDGRQTLVAFD